MRYFGCWSVCEIYHAPCLVCHDAPHECMQHATFCGIPINILLCAAEMLLLAVHNRQYLHCLMESAVLSCNVLLFSV